MRTKKLIAMLLTLVMTVSLLAGMGGSALADDEVISWPTSPAPRAAGAPCC